MSALPLLLQVSALMAEGTALEQRAGELGDQLAASQAQVAQLQGQAREDASAAAHMQQALSEQVSGLQAQVRPSCEPMPVPSSMVRCAPNSPGRTHNPAFSTAPPLSSPISGACQMHLLPAAMIGGSTGSK